MDDQELQAALLRYSGGYIFPASIESAPMCLSCRCPVTPPYIHCYRCHGYEAKDPGLRDIERGFLYYAFSKEQSHWLMRQYKGQQASQSQRQNAFTVVGHYLYLTLKYHWNCLERKGLPPFDAWTLVPSTRDTEMCSSLDHPLYTLIDQALHRCNVTLPHIEVRSHPGQGNDLRELDSDRFIVVVKNGHSPSHVLVVDDTWVGGGRISSLALCVQNTLHTRVSLLTIARYISKDFPASASLVQRKDHADLISYQPIEHCPWSADGRCP